MGSSKKEAHADRLLSSVNREAYPTLNFSAGSACLFISVGLAFLSFVSAGGCYTCAPLLGCCSFEDTSDGIPGSGSSTKQTPFCFDVSPDFVLFASRMSKDRLLNWSLCARAVDKSVLEVSGTHGWLVSLLCLFCEEGNVRQTRNPILHNAARRSYSPMQTYLRLTSVANVNQLIGT